MGKISRIGNRCTAPDIVTIPYIESEDPARDIIAVCQVVVDAAVRMAYRGKRFVKWREILAGKKAHAYTGEYLPDETVNSIKEYMVCLKGPLDVSGNGLELSINDALCEELDLYTVYNPVVCFPGMASLLRKPERLNMHIFHHNQKDLFQRTIHAAFGFAFNSHASNITFLHNGEQEDMVKMGYRIADYDYSENTLSTNVCKTLAGYWGEDAVEEEMEKAMMEGKIIVKDIDEDNFIKNTVKYPEEYSTVISFRPNETEVVKQVGKLAGTTDVIPKCVLNAEKGYALFGAYHQYSGKMEKAGVQNLSSFVLSAAMMLEYIGWSSAGRLIVRAMESCFAEGLMVEDMNLIVPDSKILTMMEYKDALIEHLGKKSFGEKY